MTGTKVLIVVGVATLWFAALSGATGVKATTGNGCWTVVKVAAGDALNLRSEPNARSAVYLRLSPDRYNVISGGSDRLTAEMRCVPTDAAIASRWCPVGVLSDQGWVHGWLKRRFIAPTDCP